MINGLCSHERHMKASLLHRGTFSVKDSLVLITVVDKICRRSLACRAEFIYQGPVMLKLVGWEPLPSLSTLRARAAYGAVPHEQVCCSCRRNMRSSILVTVQYCRFHSTSSSA